MNHRFTTHLTALAAVALLLFGASQAMAAGGTDAGTTITNNATINYQVGSVSPPSITSADAEFVVDHKIDPVVVNDGGATVVPNGTGYALKFTVTNNSNTKAADTLQLKLTTEAGTRDFDMANVKIYADDGTTADSFDGDDSEITASNPFVTLAKDGQAVIYIVGEAPGTALDDETAIYHLIAQAWTGGAEGVAGAALGQTGSNTVGSEDVIFVDASGTATGDGVTDGKHSNSGTYTVGTAQLSISKTSAVIGGTGYYLPTETVEYTITVSNHADASATATNITVSDSLDTEITAGTVAFSTGTIKVTAPNINSGAEKTLTDADDTDEGDWNVTGTNTVTVSGIELAAGASATVKFRVTIQ